MLNRMRAPGSRITAAVFGMSRTALTAVMPPGTAFGSVCQPPVAAAAASSQRMLRCSVHTPS